MQYLIEAARSKKLDRITLGYAVAAWAIVQAASIAAPAYFWPSWVLQIIIAAALLGLPIVLIGAWAIGVRAETGGALKPSRADIHVLAALALFLIVAAPLFLWIFWPRSTPGAAAEADMLAAPPNSVAVLPFVNMSGQANQEYFSDGISEELLDRLSETPALHVAARMSSFAFKGRNTSVQDIAHALHVRALLEGSVREAGNRVRIAAQLINVPDGFGLWSATYDRDLTNILTVQSDIAASITAALTRKLAGPGEATAPADSGDREAFTGSARKLAGAGEATAQAPADSVDREAYRLTLKAKELIHRGNEDDLTQAAALLREATGRAPSYAPAYAALAGALRSLVDFYSKRALLDSAEVAARQAISLDPGNVQALNTLTTMLLDRWQWKPGLDVFRKMEAANPNSEPVLHQRSIVAFMFNYPAEDLAAEKKAVELDPLDADMQYGLALWYWNEQRYGEAAAAIHRVRQLRQGKFQDVDMECLIETGLHHLNEARGLRDSIVSYYAQSPQNPMSCPFMLALVQGDKALARKITDAAAADAEKSGGSFFNVGDNYRMLGDLKAAMPWYERAYEIRDTLLLFAPFEKYQTPDLVRYPAWKALWSRPPIREWEAARVEAGQILGAGANGG